MTQTRVYKAIGLMSGTSLDGVDAALIETDGRSYVRPVSGYYLPYPTELKDKIRKLFGKTERDENLDAHEQEITLLQARAVREFISRDELSDIDVIGFHGQTITHKPKEGFTWQLGDGALMAKETGITVVNDFRTADVKAGGEGAPLIPLYHEALARAANIDLPAVFLNIGGVGNVTWIGEEESNIIAFDTGPGNALMDDYMKVVFDKAHDENGNVASQGNAHFDLIRKWLDNAYLKKAPPKSLDRGFLPEKNKKYTNADMNAWNVSEVWNLSHEDAMATLAQLTASTIAKASDHFPALAKAWYVCGGGRHNLYLMNLIEAAVETSVKSINSIGYNGDTIEAEGFAYLAVRHLLNLPLSLPSTTGVKKPMRGGVLHQ